MFGRVSSGLRLRGASGVGVPRLAGVAIGSRCSLLLFRADREGLIRLVRSLPIVAICRDNVLDEPVVQLTLHRDGQRSDQDGQPERSSARLGLGLELGDDPVPTPSDCRICSHAVHSDTLTEPLQRSFSGLLSSSSLLLRLVSLPPRPACCVLILEVPLPSGSCVIGHEGLLAPSRPRSRVYSQQLPAN